MLDSGLKRPAWLVLALFAICGQGFAQSAADPPFDPSGPQTLRVCCRPLPKWSGSKNLLLFGLNRMIVHQINHCYIDFGEAAMMPGMNASFQTSGIHPIRSHNDDKQPMPDQITDSLTRGGECRKVEDATPDKINLLREELAGGACNSCGANYHNHVISFCFNNSNTYVYDLIVGAGMMPPKMKRAPGYRRHHVCGGQDEPARVK
jgi:hypothetical protein